MGYGLVAILPATLHKYVLDREMIERSQAFLRKRGRLGLEAIVLWLGRPLDDTTAYASIEVVPSQVARRGEDGVSVEVPPEAISELLGLLPEDLFVLIRVHSHPGRAYHSETDDRNMLISHQGAISIVVPSFASGPFELGRCSINELRHGVGWVELAPDEVVDRFRVL